MKRSSADKAFIDFFELSKLSFESVACKALKHAHHQKYLFTKLRNNSYQNHLTLIKFSLWRIVIQVTQFVFIFVQKNIWLRKCLIF